MSAYWERLKIHPGVPVASIMSAAFVLASLPHWIVGAIAAVFVWVPVLVTARTQPLPTDRGKS